MEENYKLIRYTFKAQIDLYDIINTYSHVKTTNKIKYIVYEILPVDENPTYTNTTMNLKHVSDWELLDEYVFKSTPNKIYSMTDKIERLNISFPTECLDIVIKYYEDKLGHTLNKQKLCKYKSKLKNYENIEKAYLNELKKEKKILNGIPIINTVYNGGCISPIAFISSDLTYALTMFKNKEYLKKWYKDTIQYNKVYFMENAALLGIEKTNTNITKDDETFNNLKQMISNL